MDAIRPRLLTSRLLGWANPWLIPPERQAANPRFVPRPFYLPPVAFEGGLTVEDLNRGEPVDVWTKASGAASPTLLVENLRAGETGGTNAISVPTLMADADQFAKLTRSRAYPESFILRPHQAGPLDPLWSSPPVSPLAFEDVGHPLFAPLCGWVGGLAGRWFFATRDPEAAVATAEPPAGGDGPEPSRPEEYPISSPGRPRR